MISERRKGIATIGFLFLTWSTVHILLILVYGHRELYDAAGYLKGADFVLANGELEDVHHVFYLTHISIIIFFRWLFPHQVYPTIIFQCILSALALICLYKTSLKIFNNRLAGFLSCMFFLCWWDNIQWNITLMTESLACSLIFFLIFVLSQFMGSTKDFILIFVLLALSFFTRPTGVILITAVVAFLLVYYWESVKKIRGLKSVLIAGIIVLGVFTADRMFSHWDFTDEYIQGNIVTYMNRSEGTIWYEPSLRLDPSKLVLPPAGKRPLLKMFIFMYDNPLHFLKASTLKLWYLLTATRPYYTWLHNTFSVFWMVTIYTFFLFGWRQLVNKAFQVFASSILLINCLLVAISTVDWNNRFYITMVPVIVLIAGMGAAIIFDNIQKSNGFKIIRDSVWISKVESQ